MVSGSRLSPLEKYWRKHGTPALPSIIHPGDQEHPFHCPLVLMWSLAIQKLAGLQRKCGYALWLKSLWCSPALWGSVGSGLTSLVLDLILLSSTWLLLVPSCHRDDSPWPVPAPYPNSVLLSASPQLFFFPALNASSLQYTQNPPQPG